MVVKYDQWRGRKSLFSAITLLCSLMFTASQVSDILGADTILQNTDLEIASLSIDSRQITHGKSTCFVALSGLRSDGHQFLTQVWQSGVRNFIVDKDIPLPELPESNVFRVQDTISALQLLSAAHRTKFSLPCIGITGSNGKTWVKEWLYQLLSPEYFIVKSPRSYNSQIGVPLSILQIRKDHTLGIFEAGISLKGEMSRLSDIIRPAIGILTHMGDAHQAGFASMEEKLKEKLRLFKTATTIVYCVDEDWIADIVRHTYSYKTLLAWSMFGRDADLKINNTHIQSGSAQIQYTYHAIMGTYRIPFTDQASIRNSITCCIVMLHLGYKPDMIAARMEGLYPIALRLAIHHLPGDSVLINDAYSLDLGSLSVALETLKQHSAVMQRTVIVSDIDHQHAGSYMAMADLFAQKAVDHVLGIGNEVGQLGAMLPPNISFSSFRDNNAFVAQKPWESFMPGAFLLKGARSFQFEQLAGHMQGRYHSAVLEIDLNTLLHNLQFFTSRLNSETKIIAMVKAAAYGSGGAEIARFLAFHNVAILAVAYIDEGIDLRNGGVQIPILVMNPDPARVDQLYAHKLEPEVFDFSLLQAIGAYERKEGMRIHVKVDSGMHRLGFKKEDIPKLLKWIKNHKDVSVVSVFTHLAAAGDVNERAFTLNQIETFNTFYNALIPALGNSPERHVLNTSGVLHFPEYQYEAVRLGIGLYGAGIEPGIPLEPVHTLKARISQIHDIEGGESVGYDRAFTAPTPMRIGTINIGYADGLRRCAGNQKYAVYIQGRPAPILGKVCMDMTMIDLRAHSDARPGDEVIIFGPNHSVDDLARVCDTIPYEILTGISQRVARVLLYS